MGFAVNPEIRVETSALDFSNCNACDRGTKQLDFLPEKQELVDEVFDIRIGHGNVVAVSRLCRRCLTTLEMAITAALAPSLS